MQKSESRSGQRWPAEKGAAMLVEYSRKHNEREPRCDGLSKRAGGFETQRERKKRKKEKRQERWQMAVKVNVSILSITGGKRDEYNRGASLLKEIRC